MRYSLRSSPKQHTNNRCWGALCVRRAVNIHFKAHLRKIGLKTHVNRSKTNCITVFVHYMAEAERDKAGLRRFHGCGRVSFAFISWLFAQCRFKRSNSSSLVLES